MKLIAKKPCSFGGRKFFIGEEVPIELVADPTVQEKLGVITISNVEDKIVLDLDGTYTQEQVDTIITAAVAEATARLRGLEEEFKGTVQIGVRGESDGDNESVMVISATPEEIQQAFYIMQLNVEEGAKTIAEIEAENVLILLHAADSRKTIKDAAKKQADNLFSMKEKKSEFQADNAFTGTNLEGDDT